MLVQTHLNEIICRSNLVSSVFYFLSYALRPLLRIPSVFLHCICSSSVHSETAFISLAATETSGIRLDIKAHQLWEHAATCWSTLAFAAVDHDLVKNMVEKIITVCLVIFVFVFVFFCTHVVICEMLLSLYLNRTGQWHECPVSIHRANMEITSNERSSQQPPLLCSDLSLRVDPWSAAKQTKLTVVAHWDSLRQRTQLSKVLFTFPPHLFGISCGSYLPMKCIVYRVHWLGNVSLLWFSMSQSSNALKNGTALSSCIADCETC